MTALDLATLHLSSRSVEAFDVAEFAGATTHAATIESPMVALPTRPEEPTSLALALIGAVTLAAYRGIQRRLAPPAAAQARAQAPIKPRRRAA